MKAGRAAFWMLQAAVAVVVGVFVWRAIVRQWDAFRALEFDVTIRVGWVALAAVVVWATYALLIEAWRRVLRGWGQPLSYRDAVRIWTVSNLGRYLPGKVWSLAGLAVLAQRRGVAGWAAGGSAVAMQVIAIGTGAGVVAATVRGSVSAFSLGLAGVVASLAIGALLLPGPMRFLSRITGREDMRPLGAGALLAAAAATTLAWTAYGVALWCLGRGVIGDAASALSLGTAVGVFAAGYITGLLAVFAPGGVGVREVIFIGLLTPTVGGGAAIALSVASRLLLTLTEVVAAGFALLISRPGRVQ